MRKIMNQKHFSKNIFFKKKKFLGQTYVHAYTVWKLQDFSVTQILREIKVGQSRNTKSAILTHLETLNFNFYEILHFLEAEINQINKIQSP